MLTDSVDSEQLQDERTATSRKLIAALLAIIFTGGLFAGYIYFKNRQAKHTAAAAQAKNQLAGVPKGPPKAHILVDEALLKGGQTIIGGSVKNISDETLSGLAVDLELKRRKDATIERMSVKIDPAELDPTQEGHYVLKLPAQQFSSARLVGLNAGSPSSPLSYTTAPGQKRPLERLEPKTVVVPRSAKPGEFLNSPDNPARVP